MLMNSPRMSWLTTGAPDAADAWPAPEPNPLRGTRIEVTALRGWRDRNRFVDLPYRLHRSNPNWVPPLRRDTHRLLDRRRNPVCIRVAADFVGLKRSREVTDLLAITREIELHGRTRAKFPRKTDFRL